MSKNAKDEAKQRKKLRDNCKIIIQRLEKIHERDVADLLSYVRNAETPGTAGARKTKSLAEHVWHTIAFQKRSNLMQAIRDDDFVLFELFMSIKGESREQAVVKQTHLCYCIDRDTDYDYAKALLEAGADPNAEGLDGFTPMLKLISAAETAYSQERVDWLADRMAMLLRHGANPTQPLSRVLHMRNIVFGAGENPITVCDRLELNGERGSKHIKALQKLRAVMVAKAEEKILADELTVKAPTFKRRLGI